MASITVTKKKQKQKIKEPQIKITWKEIKRQKVHFNMVSDHRSVWSDLLLICLLAAG